MEFFDRMLVLADKVHDRISPSPYHISASQPNNKPYADLDYLKIYLTEIHAHLRGVLSVQKYHAADAGDLLCFIASIHNTLEDTLNAIDREQEKNHEPHGKLHKWGLHLDTACIESISIENEKLRVLLCTFNHDGKEESIIQEDFKQWRSKKIDQYIDIEIQRCGRHERSIAPDTYNNHKTKWEKLNDPHYLANVLGDILCDDSSPASLVGFIHCFIRNLRAARDQGRNPADRWLHLTICSHYLLCVRASSEYQNFSADFDQPQNTKVIGTGLTIQNYVAELELLLFGCLTDLETEYLEPSVVQERTRKHPPRPPPTPDSNRKESDSGNSSPSNDLDDSGVVFTCLLTGEQNGYVLKIRRDIDSILSLDFDRNFDRWPVELRPFRGLDLRKASVYPRYHYDRNIYKCDLHLERRAHGRNQSLYAQLTFKSSADLKGFQKAVTGYKVVIGFKQNIMLCTLKKHPLFTSNLNVITGGLQIWSKEAQESPDPTVKGILPTFDRAATALSTMSRSSFASTATLKAQQKLPGAQLTTIDEGEGLQIEEPVAPLLVMFVESSSRDDGIRAGDILFFKFDQNAKIDPSKCKCDDKKAKCPRCFIMSATRVELEIGRWKYPKKPKELSWVQANFANDKDRETFTRYLEEARKDYNTRKSDHSKAIAYLNRGWHNTNKYN